MLRSKLSHPLFDNDLFAGSNQPLRSSFVQSDKHQGILQHKRVLELHVLWEMDWNSRQMVDGHSGDENYTIIWETKLLEFVLSFWYWRILLANYWTEFEFMKTDFCRLWKLSRARSNGEFYWAKFFNERILNVQLWPLKSGIPIVLNYFMLTLRKTMLSFSSWRLELQSLISREQLGKF